MRKQKQQQAPIVIEASSLSEKLEQNQTLRFISQNGRLVSYVLVALVLLFYVFYRVSSNNKLDTQRDYIQAEQYLSSFRTSRTTDSADLLSSLQKIIDRRPELHAKYDGLIAQTLIKRGEESAHEFATAMFERTAELGPALNIYQDYSETSLFISEGHYEQALQRALALDEQIKVFEIVDAPTPMETNSLATVMAFNQLRIALLHQQMNHPTEELEAWKTVKNSWSTDNQTITPAQLFQKGKVSLSDYIAARKEFLNK